MAGEIIEWLQNSPDWITYAVETQLLGNNPDKNKIIKDPSIDKIIGRLKDREVGIPSFSTGKVTYSASVYWDLFLLADIGLAVEDVGLEKEVEMIFDMQQDNGSFLTSDEYKPNYHCISAILISPLIKMGYKDDPRIKKYVDLLATSQRLDGGWHCAKRRAIGAKQEDSESCPMDNLNILMVLGSYDSCRTNQKYNGAIDLLLNHWNRQGEKWRPYGFGIGSEFKKLRYPAVKYGILRVLDVLSLFPYALENDQFKSMVDFVKEKSGDGKYKAESIMKSFISLDFGQKKEPSRWITFLVHRIEKRMKNKIG